MPDRYGPRPMPEAVGGAEVTEATRPPDDATDRQLRLLVGLVVVLAVGGFAFSVWLAARHHTPPPNLVSLLALTSAVVVASRVKVEVRIRGNRHGTSWSEVPII